MSTVQDSLTHQQFSMITTHEQPFTKSTNRLQLHVFISVRIGVLNCPLFLINGCLSVM